MKPRFDYILLSI